jgi:hypothetical protein
MLHVFYLDVAYVTGYTRMLQVFYLDVAYIAVVIHICCKRMFKLFHLDLVCCNRCCSPHALICGAGTRCTKRPCTTSVVPHGGACSWLNTYSCVLCSFPLPLILGHACCALSHIRVHVQWSLSHVAGSLLHWGTRVVLSLSYCGTHAMFPLSLTCSWAGSRRCGAQQQGGGVGHNSRRCVVPKKAREGTGSIRRNSMRECPNVTTLS